MRRMSCGDVATAGALAAAAAATAATTTTTTTTTPATADFAAETAVPCAASHQIVNITGTSNAPVGHRMRSWNPYTMRMTAQSGDEDCIPCKTVNVTGASNAPFGFRMHNPKPRTMLAAAKGPLPQGPPDDGDLTTRPTSDDIFALLLRDEQGREKKVIKESIRRRVELGMEAFEEDVDARRDKLRVLLLREEAALTRELIEECRRLEQQRLAELAARAAEAEREREAARLALLHEKRLQRFAASSMEVRADRQKAWIENAKRTNVVQIAEMEERRRAEMEDEAYWHAVLLNGCEAQAATEASIASIRATIERETADQLRCQMLDRLNRRQAELKAEEEARRNGVAETLLVGKTDEELELARRWKRRKLREDLELQIAEAKRSLEARLNEERALDRMTASIAAVDGAGDRTRNKEAKRREILAYMEHLKEFREAMARRDAEVEDCVRRLATEMDKKQCEKRRQAREDKARLARELQRTWEKQFKDKCSREQKELDRDIATGESREEYEAALLAERVKRHHAAREYGRELIAQRDEGEGRRAYERRQDGEYEELQSKKLEREERKLLQELRDFGTQLRITGIP